MPVQTLSLSVFYLLHTTHIYIMTTVIMKDKDWLKEQIESGIQGFLENESEYLISLIKKYVYEQIYLAAIIPHSESDQEGCASISININIVAPESATRFQLT